MPDGADDAQDFGGIVAGRYDRDRVALACEVTAGWRGVHTPDPAAESKTYDRQRGTPIGIETAHQYLREASRGSVLRRDDAWPNGGLARRPGGNGEHVAGLQQAVPAQRG